MEHPAQHIDAVFGAVEVFCELFAAPTSVLDFDIPPAVDVDFFNVLAEDVLCQKGVFSHLGEQGIHQLLRCHATHCHTAVLHKLGDIPFDMRLGFGSIAVREQLAVLSGDMLLHLLQNTTEVIDFLLRGKK